MSYKGRTKFKGGKKMSALITTLAAITFAIAVLSTVYGAAVWVQVVCWLLVGFLVLGIFDAATVFVTLDETHLVFRTNLRKREIRRNDIAFISSERGCPVTVHLNDGSRVEMPPVGEAGIENSLRAWVKADQR